jgi:hypothetical protein
MSGPSEGRARPRILFVALVNDVGIDRVPMAMGALGALCAVLSPPGFYCTTTRFVSQWFPLPSHHGAWFGIPFLRPRLEAAARFWKADLIVPLDSVSAQLLRVLAKSGATSRPLRALLEQSLGSPKGYSAACSRAGLMTLAAGLDVRMPRFRSSHDASVLLEAAADWGYPVVLKAENTCGGHGVRIATKPSELAAATGGLRGGSAWRRWRTAARETLWSAAGMQETAFAPPMVQDFLPGVPAMRTVSTWQGQVLEGVSFVAEHVFPVPFGPSTMVRHVENEEMATTARQLVAALGCSGFMSFDFMLDETTGAASLIELNPRPIGTSHLGQVFGHDLCARLLACVMGQETWHHPPPVAIPRPPLTKVALFPKEIERNPANLDRLHAVDLHHDVPHDDQGVLDAYLRRLAGLYPDALPAIIEAIDADSVRRAARVIADPALENSTGSAL